MRRKTANTLLDVFGSVAFAALCLACLAHALPRIEDDVYQRAAREITLFPWASIHIDGRTVHLSGTIYTPGDQGWALKRLRGVEGVRRVVDQTEVAPVPAQKRR